MSEESPVAILYRWSVEPEFEDYFRKRWLEGTVRLKRDFGALGSCLTRADNGDFVAFARWPSAKAREDAFAALGPRESWPGIIRFEEQIFEVLDDYLTS